MSINTKTGLKVTTSIKSLNEVEEDKEECKLYKWENIKTKSIKGKKKCKKNNRERVRAEIEKLPNK